MPKDASPNGEAAPDGGPAEGPHRRVSEMQVKLHRWAVADPGRRFDDLFNFVYDPATLWVAYVRVSGNAGARTAGIDGMTVADVDREIGVPAFLEELRSQLKERTFRPLPVRERKIPKPGGSGKLRKLGIPTVADRVVQAALKLVLEPIFEADFVPVSYGFRPNRRAHDAVAEIHHFGSAGYRRVLDADIEACFDNIDHTALMGRVRRRVADKRVLALVKAFLKAGVLTQDSGFDDTHTGTPQGGILSPLLANIALSVLDEHLHGPWQAGGAFCTSARRQTRRRHGLPVWRMIRYADDFVVLVDGTPADMVAIEHDITQVLATIGLRLSASKTQTVHLRDGVDFLGFHLRYKRKRGSRKWYVYTFISDRALGSIKTKVRALARRTAHHPGATLTRLNQVIVGWATYFQHACAKIPFSSLARFIWWRVICWLRNLHHWSWGHVRARFTTASGKWLPITIDDVTLYNLAAKPVTRYRYRGNKIPTPWTEPIPA